MIAVWLVGPPSEVASPMTSVGSRPAVSAGARSSASRIEGTSGVGMPGSGAPDSSAMTRSRTSRRSVTRSAIRPPSFWNRSTNWSVAAAAAATAGRPELTSFSAAPCQPRSSTMPALAASTSAAAPLRVRRPVPQPPGDGRGRRPEGFELGGTIGLVDVGPVHLRGQALTRPDGRAGGDTRDHRRALQNRLRTTEKCGTRHSTLLTRRSGAKCPGTQFGPACRRLVPYRTDWQFLWSRLLQTLDKPIRSGIKQHEAT